MMIRHYNRKIACFWYAAILLGTVFGSLRLSASFNADGCDINQEVVFAETAVEKALAKSAAKTFSALDEYLLAKNNVQKFQVSLLTALAEWLHLNGVIHLQSDNQIEIVPTSEASNALNRTAFGLKRRWNTGFVIRPSLLRRKTLGQYKPDKNVVYFPVLAALKLIIGPVTGHEIGHAAFFGRLMEGQVSLFHMDLLGPENKKGYEGFMAVEEVIWQAYTLAAQGRILRSDYLSEGRSRDRKPIYTKLEHATLLLSAYNNLAHVLDLAQARLRIGKNWFVSGVELGFASSREPKIATLASESGETVMAIVQVNNFRIREPLEVYNTKNLAITFRQPFYDPKSKTVDNRKFEQHMLNKTAKLKEVVNSAQDSLKDIRRLLPDELLSFELPISNSEERQSYNDALRRFSETFDGSMIARITAAADLPRVVTMPFATSNAKIVE